MFGVYNAYHWKRVILQSAVILVLTLLCCTHAQNCGSTLTASTDEEQAIGSPAVVGPLDCQWTITTPESQKYVLLTVVTLSISETPNCERDRIEIWSKGVISDEEEPQKLCGEVGRWNYFHSTEQRMLVRFISAGIVPGQTMNFQLSYIADGSIPKPQLFIAMQSKLCRFSSYFPSSNSDMTCFLEDQRHLVGLAVDVADQTIFYSDIGAETINSVKLFRGSDVSVLSGGTQSVEGMAVDWISNNVYWTDNPAGMISVSTYGGHRKDLITTDVIAPRSIAVDPLEKYLFWGEFGPPAQIERSDLDGGNRIVLVSDDIQTPNGLTLDYSQQTLYFADAKTGAIQTIGYDGLGRSLFYQKESPATHNFFGMTIFQDFLIWSEFGPGNGLYVANRNTGELIKENPIPNEAIFSVVMYADFNQPDGDGPCAVDNGGCYQLCLPSSRAADGRFCYCSFGFYLADDGITCGSHLVEDNFALITDSYSRKVYQVDLTDPEYSPNGLSLGTIANPMAVAYDPQEKRVYWSDVVAHSISRAGLDGSYSQVIISEDIEVPDGLTVEPVSRLLFWTDIGRQTISVSMLSGDRRVTLISDGLEKPRAIALDPQEGYMYWSDWGAVAKIERSFMDGTGREPLINVGLGWPNGLAVDTQGRKLYWCDAQVNKIEMSDLNGSNRIALIDSSIDIHPYGIGIYGDYLFYSDWAYSSLVRADRLTGENNELVGSSQLQRPNELHIYSSSVPWEGYPACSVDNGGCSGLCLSSSIGRTCHCGDSTELGNDGISCAGEALIQCNPQFEQGDLGSCTGSISEICSVSCWTGFTNRIISVTCLSSGNWDEDLSTVCEEAEIIHEPAITTAPVPVVTSAPEVSGLDVSIQTSTSTPAIGQNVRLSCSVDDDTAEILWYKDEVFLESGTVDNLFVLTDAITIVGFDVIHQGQYSCSAYREADGAFSEALLRLDLPLDILYASYPVNTTVELGGNQVLQCAVIDRLHTIQWEKDGAPLLMNEHVFQEFGDSLLLRDATIGEAGIYTCVLLVGTQRIAQVSATLYIDTHLVIEDVCGTITAEEAINPGATSDVSARIVRGSKAIHGSAPWMVRLYDLRTRSHFCGGSLVNNYWVITAAHCIRGTGIGVDELLLRLGDYDTYHVDDSEETALVQAIHIPAGYNSSVYDQDIALLKLRDPIYVFDDYIRPICLPDISMARVIYHIGTQGKVTGFGEIAFSGPLPRYLSEVTLPLVGKRQCRASTTQIVTNNMFCAGYPRESGDACRGDSGGPFVVEHEGRWYLFGIVSWGEGCGQDGKYGFYTRIPKLINWINSYINH